MGIHEMWLEFVMGKFTREQFYLCGNISDMLFSTFMLQPILGVHLPIGDSSIGMFIGATKF
jgi:hypothetical protein